MHATIETEAAQVTKTAIRIEGQDAWIASEDNITEGILAASAVFSRHHVDPFDCEKANKKMINGKELLSEQEALLSLIWEEADYAAFHAITVGWLSRDIDIQITVR
ncbi:MAG TPA: hypothetical protein VMV88_06930 [Gallionella sp.]|nr:hypothetical protein [Gallionella sp.]